MSIFRVFGDKRRAPGLCWTTSATGSTVLPHGAHRCVLGYHGRALPVSLPLIRSWTGCVCVSVWRGTVDDDDDGGGGGVAADETEWSRAAGRINRAP